MKTQATQETRDVRANRSAGIQNQLASTAQCQQATEIQNSPYMAAQRKQLQSVMGPVVQKKNETNMPDAVKSSMESSFNQDFSHVRIHANSSKAPDVGALAYTQGSDIHFAPGQYSPDSSSGQKLLGHELTHVVQQGEGRVRPTTEVNGMPVNDNPALEKEADVLGGKASG